MNYGLLRTAVEVCPILRLRWLLKAHGTQTEPVVGSVCVYQCTKIHQFGGSPFRAFVVALAETYNYFSLSPIATCTVLQRTQHY